MFTLPTPRSSRFLLKTPRSDLRITTRVIFPVSSTKNNPSSTRNFSIPRSQLLNDSLNKSQRLQKSLESIRIKKQETESIYSKYTERKIKVLRVRVDIAKVNLKFHRAALFIQKVFRGYLTRKKLKPILLKRLHIDLVHGIKSLEAKVDDIWIHTQGLNDNAKVIQKHVRMFLNMKKNEFNAKVENIGNKIKLSLAAHKIQKFFKFVLSEVRRKKEFNEKLDKIRKRIRWVYVQIWWNSHKFAWATIRKHYGIDSVQYTGSDDHTTKIVIRAPNFSVIRAETKFRKKTKKNKNRNKLKPKTIKQNLTPSSIISPKPESDFSGRIESSHKQGSENFASPDEENLGIPIDKIKRLFNDLNLGEEEKEELLNEIEETSIYKNTPTPVLEKPKMTHKASNSLNSHSNKGSLSKRSKKGSFKENKKVVKGKVNKLPPK